MPGAADPMKPDASAQAVQGEGLPRCPACGAPYPRGDDRLVAPSAGSGWRCSPRRRRLMRRYHPRMNSGSITPRLWGATMAPLRSWAGTPRASLTKLSISC